VALLLLLTSVSRHLHTVSSTFLITLKNRKT